VFKLINHNDRWAVHKMHIASERWLHLYKYTTIGIQGLLLVAFGAQFVYSDRFPDFLDLLTAITPLQAGIAFIAIVFGLAFYAFAERTSRHLPPAILGALLTLNVVSLMHASGGLHSDWVLVWAIICLLGGILGPAIAAAPSFIMTFYFVLLKVSAFNGVNESKPLLDTRGIIVLVGTYVLSYVSWFVWRRFYVDPKDVEVERLTGQLKSRQQLSDVLIQSITDGIVVTDTKGKISITNPAAAEMTGWPVDESANIDVKTVMDLREEDGKEIPEQENIFTQVLASRQSIEKIAQLIGRDDKKRTVSIAVSPINIPGNEELAGAVAVVRDVSAAREEEARRADFISTASHEMRTPVAAIEGYLALALNEKVSKIDNSARNYLNKAYSSTKHLGKLFQDLLTSAKAEDGRLVSHPTVVEIGEYIEKLADDLRFTAEKKGLLVDVVVGSAENTDADGSVAGGKTIKPLYYAMADPDRLSEVITNLFDNAVKYTESGKISIGLTGNNDIIQLFIKDTGPGIPAEDVPHLFQKFYRVDNSATRTIGGTGLGLFICRKIIEIYNGRIWVESKVGEGSTFYINLPRISSQEAMTNQK